VEKTKITQKDFDEIYELIPNLEDNKNIPEKEESKNFTFEEYTEQYDKNIKKELEEDAS